MRQLHAVKFDFINMSEKNEYFILYFALLLPVINLFVSNLKGEILNFLIALKN